MEEPIVGINQRVKDMEISDKFSENDQLLMREELPPRYSDGYTFRDFLRGLGFDPDEVLNPENRTNSYVPTPQTGFTLVPSGGHSSCFQAVGPGEDKELAFPCADQALADFNSKTRTINVLKVLAVHVFMWNFIWDATVSIATSLLWPKQNPSWMGIFSQNSFLLMRSIMLMAPLVLSLTLA